MLETLINTDKIEMERKLKNFIGSLPNWSELNPVNDLAAGLYAFHVWGALGWHDIRQRYRRSVLGPLWFTLSTVVYVGMMGLIYSTILTQNVEDYNAYLAIGLITWQYISTCALEGCNAFIGAAGLIKQIRMPVTIHICRLVWRNLIIFLHNLPIFILLIILSGRRLDAGIILIFPGLIVLFLVMVAVGVILGIICARFRDVLPIVTNVIQVAFFVTPIMFEPKLLKNYKWIAEFNPIYHLIEIVRAPIIGHKISYTSWGSTIFMLILAGLVAQNFMRKYRDRIVYWI